MALKLKRTPKATESQVSPQAGTAAVEESSDPGTPRIPGASYNMMTIRYVVEQRRSVVALVIAGAAAAALILMVGSWLSTRGSISDVQGEKLVLEQEMATLSEQITAMADTGGMTPERVYAMRDERIRAFVAAVSGELDYQTIIEKLAAFNTSRAWLTSYKFSSDGGQVTVSASGQAVAPDAVTDFYDAVRAGLAGEATVTETWPPVGFSGTADTPGSFPATITFTSRMTTDRFSPLGLDPETIGRIAPPPASEQPAEGEGVGAATDGSMDTPVEGDGS